ncbi:hypothetical protein ABT337_09925 [Saccharopolyspora hirsuta]|uniref:PLL-like beta propeller domain-containing protein n=1 Tax=Saccharopolyspora hirsuta TaxID=1837 RepID=A0A5M7BPH6_SACHI|nr:hypothetical protein [Saccharopolyspora hirsuta]KAA5830107.1 hypothetical protein F1721_23710 [Saccharopolyspora hirsuta]
MPLFTRGDRPGRSGGSQAPVPLPDHPALDQPTMPMVPVQRRSDRRLLVLAGIGGLILITAPIVAFSQATGLKDAAAPGVPSPVVPGVVSQPRPTVISPLPGAPVAVDNARRLALLARGQDDAVLRSFTSSQSGDTPSGWTNLGGSAAGAPVAVRDGHGELAAFYIGVDGHLWFKHQAAQAQAPFEQWTDLAGGGLVGTPAVAPDAQGKLVVAARAADGAVRVVKQAEIGADEWTDWRPLPAVAEGDPVIYRDSRGKLRVFAIGPDRQMWAVAETSAGANEWTPPTSMGGDLSGTPAAAMDAKGRLCVFALRADGSLQKNREAEAASGTWSGWQDMGQRLVGKPVAINDAKGTVVIYGLNEHGALQEIWGIPPEVKAVDHGGAITELVGAAQDPTGRIFVYGIGAKGSMVSTHQEKPAAGPWTDWSDELGGVFTPLGQ